MTRRDFASGLLGCTAASAANRPMNVLLMIADDLNDSLGCYGNPVVRTPNLDALARRGFVFENAYCQFPLCQPSRTSLLSGLRPESTKVWTLDTPTRKNLGDAVMLPELFRRNGYFTAHAGKIFHTGEHAEDPRSWDVERREFGKNPQPSEVLRSGNEREASGHSFRWDILKTPDAETPDGVQARQTVAWLEQCAHDRRPFFLATGFRRPHAPYSAPSHYFGLYPADRMPLPAKAIPPDVPRRVAPALTNSDAKARDRIPPAAFTPIASLTDCRMRATSEAIAPDGANPVDVFTYAAPASSASLDTRCFSASVR